MGKTAVIRLAEDGHGAKGVAAEELLDRVFFALCDPVRRKILDRLGEQSLLVSELAAPFDISLQAVSRHIQVLVRAGLVQQERTGRISRCSIDVAPIFAAAVWINRYSKYWQRQFEALAGWLDALERAHRKGERKNARGKPGKRVLGHRIARNRGGVT